MGVGEALPGRVPPDRGLHESERTRVSRVSVGARVVIRKEPLGPEASRRVQHEVAILERLRGVWGVVQLADAPRCPGSVIMTDVGGTSLNALAKPLAVADLIALAAGLARAVAGMHRQGVLHGDITPANILICRDGAPCLVDFALASSSAQIRPEFTHHSEIVGTLAYLAPEQTGRTGWPVDQRADLYALGATLYELATGEPPFGSGDPLRLTHDHLARVPVPPARVNPALPAPLSEIVMHLLEKEPDNRYQTADGLMYDLERLRDTGPAAAGLRVGERDVPLRLVPPSRLVGRDAEVAALAAAFEEALAGRCRGVLVSGVPGVGKTALVDELRPVVTGGDGWFVTGKFDQYRRDLEFDALHQAFRGLGQLLLAEPEDELAEVRERILRAIGPYAGQLAAVVPEFAALLGVPPDPGDPLTAQARVQRTSVEALRAVASRKRPMVVFVDDLQWAGRTPLGMVDLMLSEEPVEGLLLVVAYREGDVDAAHPLAAPLTRWREQAGVRHLRLVNLPVPDTVAVVAEMLRVPRAEAAGLVELVEPHVSGNPYETVELLNSLRRDGALAATAAGWRWDSPSVRAQLDRSEVAGLPAAGVVAVPGRSRRVVEAMACLGGQGELSLLQAATGVPADVLEQRLAPALDEGLLVMVPGAHQAVRFRHDRIRDGVLGGLAPRRRAVLQLDMARRLACVPELFAAAAEQYLPVIDAVEDAAERRRVVGLLRRAAGQAALIGDYVLVNALLAAAVPLIDPGDATMLVEVRTARHRALYSVGRLEEADEEYRMIEGLCPTALGRVDATVVQARSLTHRNRCPEAIGLGLESLRELGLAVPAADRLAADLDHQISFLYRWLDHTEGTDELARPDLTDPTLLAAARLIGAILAAVYFAADQATFDWLSLESLRIWLEHGPARPLLGPASHTAFTAMATYGDYAAGWRAMRRVLAVGEARGYEPETSQVRFLSSLVCCWSEPVERSVEEARRAREGLIVGGELTNALHTYFVISGALLDCAPLDACLAEVKAGLAFAQQTGGAHIGETLDSYRWLAGVLRGDRSGTAGGALPAERYADNPLAELHAHATRALAAAIFGDPAGLTRHATAATPLLPASPGVYTAALVHLLHGLALAGQVRAAAGGERDGPLRELDEEVRWMAARAGEAPANFQHLLRLLEGERAWAVGDFRAAVLALDAALRDVAEQQRPWHRALISERAARFLLDHGVERAGYGLLVEARHEYLEWGATAKVNQLDWAYPGLRLQPGPNAGPAADLSRRRSTVTTGTIDLLGILSASQALSSETSIDGLHTRLVSVLSALAGATGVSLLMHSDDQHEWLLPAPGGVVPVTGTGHEQLVPLSVLRYAQRIHAPLVVDDATCDDRFSRDPYFMDVTCCSLLAVPIVSRGTLRAVLLLENRLIRGAFTTERLDAVELIAAQLAVSLDNAHLYAEHRRIANEQAALRRVATLVAQSVGPGPVFTAVAEEVAALFGADSTAIVRFEPDGEATVMGGYPPRDPPLAPRAKLDAGSVMAKVQATGQAARRDAGPPNWRELPLPGRCAVASPIAVERALWGAIGVGTRQQRLPQDTEQRLADFTELVATAIANAESRTELTTSRARIVATADQTRRRIERDLHDGAQQCLVALALQLRATQATLPSDLHTVARQLEQAVATATAAAAELRETAHGIHPSILTDGGLGPALRTLARRSPIPVELNLHTGGRLPEPIEVSAYYIVAEALTNAAKHAHASTVTITVTTDPALHVTVHDNGIGGADFTHGTGLIGLKDRAEALGGRITLRSPHGAGTRLTVDIPVTAADGDPDQ
ncbi:AAA family ATPase [Dactylosporangium sp. NPDC049140]|uniref:AAA family ATPase n=1 Tax=Dactylosporangium sp. NPDC049140 TaxID=3155647 RepID=UPI0033DE5514